jgi:hypothetical protein
VHFDVVVLAAWIVVVVAGVHALNWFLVNFLVRVPKDVKNTEAEPWARATFRVVRLVIWGAAAGGVWAIWGASLAAWLERSAVTLQILH